MLPALTGSGTRLRLLLSLTLFLLTGCVAGRVSCGDDSLVMAVHSEAEARALVLREVDPSTLPDDPRRFVENWVTEEVRKLFARNRRAAIWYFKEPKGGLGWRKGLAAVENCRRVAEFEFSDDN
jgi:hypothetical protein